MAVCASCGQENPDVARFCLACGTPFAPSPPPHEERKLVTVLFTDIVGSTASAEQLDPEDVRARLRPYYERVRRELERHGGTVEKFIGDAVVALFGAPVAHEDDPERAVRAAFAVRDAVAELNELDSWLDLRIRTAVHTGEALVVTGARTSEGEATAAGDVMNTAARLQGAAPVDGVVVGELTYRATRDVVAYRALDPVAAKGKAEPVPAWEALSLGERAAPRDGRALVGRDEELQVLVELWRDVVRGRAPATGVVLGLPGIGKSRLIAALAERAAADEGAVLRGRCLSYGEGITYWPVAEVVRGAAGIRQADRGAAAAGKLGALLESLATDEPAELRTLATAAANLLGVASSPEGRYETTDISQGELHWGIRRLLHLLARRQPLVVVLEDLHWAEPTLLELVQALGEDADDAPLLVVGSARPELRESAPVLTRSAPRREVVELGPLPAEAGRLLLAELLGSGALADDPTAARVLERAGGNPLFLEETVRMLGDAGLVDSSGWRVEGPAEALPIPTSLQGLIASRLDALPQREKRVAQHAAVVGQVFWPSAVAAIAGGDGDGDAPADVEARLALLERRDLVRAMPATSLAGERQFEFKHVLIRDVAYGEIPKGRRAELHLRFADWVERLPAAGEELVEIVAYHLEHSCRMARGVARSPVQPPLARAAAAVLLAGERAERREGYREAERWYVRGLELLDGTEPEARAELRLRQARPLAAQGRLPQALAAAGEAAEEARALGRDDLLASALVLVANVNMRLGRGGEARRALDEAVPLARTCGDAAVQVRASFAEAALVAEVGGDVERACGILRHAVGLAEDHGDRSLLVEGHLRLSFILLNSGELAGAEAAFGECVALAAELGSRRDEARALLVLGMIRFLRGGVDEAERLSLEAREAFEITGETFFQIQAAIALGRYALARGDAALAEERLKDALPHALEEGGWLLIELYRVLAATLVAQGRADDAAELVSFASARAPEEHSYAATALVLAQACVAAATGDAAAAGLYARAIANLDSLNLPLEATEARLAYARVLEGSGEVEHALRELETAQAAAVRTQASGLAEQIGQRLAAAEPGERVPPPAAV